MPIPKRCIIKPKSFQIQQMLTLQFLAKTPWSWGRMHDILSEGCEIESRRELEEPAITLRSKREEFWNWKRNRNARPRTTTDARTGALE